MEVSSKKEVEALKRQIQELKGQLEDAEKDYYGLVEKTNFHLKELFDSSNDLIQIVKPNGDFRFVNEAWRNKLGYTEDEVYDLKFMEAVHPDHRKSTLQNLLKTTAGSRMERFETVLKTKTGKNIYVIGKLTSVFEDDEATEYRFVFYDITERFRAERAQSLYYKIANITLTTSNKQDFFKRIYLELNEIVKVRNFSLALKKNRGFEYAHWVNEHEDTTGALLKKDVETMLVNYVYERGKPMIIYADGIEKIARQKRVDLTDPLPNIWLGVTIDVDAKPIGVLSIFSYFDQSEHNHNDLELLAFISGQITLAMERERSELKIQNQAARINAIFDSSSHQIWSVDRNYQFTSLNKNYHQAFEAYYGTEPKIGMSLLERPVTTLDGSMSTFWKDKYDLAFGGKTVHFQHKTDLPDGTTIWRDIFLNPIYRLDGYIEEVSAIANDITEKKQSETALKESEEKFRNIFESFQDIYFRCNMDGFVTLVSPSVFKVLGITPEEILGKKITGFFTSKAQLSQLLFRLQADRQIQNFEVEVPTLHQKAIQFLCNVRLIHLQNDEIAIEGVARDISKLKETYKQLKEAKELAEHSLQIKERFLANMSHEIRTPMNGIIGMIDLIGSTELNTEQTEYVRTIKKSSDNLLNILNDILDLSKIEAGKMELRLAPVKLVDTLRKVYNLYSQQAHNSSNTLYYHLDDKVPECIMADETRLIQVLGNLTSNAIKFSPQKGVINISLRIQSMDKEQYIFKASVKDSGIGISPEDTKKLFQSFSQIDNSSRKTFAGTGLGLAISKELVKSMGGEIGVVSTPGLGSTFWFTFQAGTTQIEPPMSIKEETSISKQFQDRSPKVLLVDDNEINRKVAGGILRKSGCSVTEADSALSAMTHVQQAKFDLIFMDIQMPDMDGVQATLQIKKLLGPQVPPIIAMTAYSMEEDEKKFINQGLDDYVSKPIKANLLIQKVKTWLGFEPQHVKLKAFDEESEALIINQNTLNQLHKFGGQELIESVLVEFEQEAQGLVADADLALKNQDYEGMRTALHTLKGNAGTLGIERMAQVSKKMEKQLKEKNYSEISILLERLKTHLAEFKENCNTLINS